MRDCKLGNARRRVCILSTLRIRLRHGAATINGRLVAAVAIEVSHDGLVRRPSEFEYLIVSGVFRLIDEDDRLVRGSALPKPYAAVLLGLATLTRPDGFLISACVLQAANAH